jgi:hypothetical protein
VIFKAIAKTTNTVEFREILNTRFLTSSAKCKTRFYCKLAS